jgi:hypothetical protein
VLTEKMGIWLHITDGAPVSLVVTGNVPTSTSISLYATTPDESRWNLVGYPAGHDTAMQTETIPALHLVYAYHPTSDPWLVYDPLAPDYANSLTALAPNGGYWVQVTQGGDWVVQY